MWNRVCLQETKMVDTDSDAIDVILAGSRILDIR